MLLGREREEARVAALIETARDGRSGAIVIRGEPGIGKTALLDEASRAEGVLVLRARGIESESDIGFSGLADLVAPIIDDMAHLPSRQSAALRAAISIGPPVETERLAICAGFLGLLAVASRRIPLVAAVDDAHLLDPASADVLAFAARRLRDDRIAMIFTIRDGESSTFRTEGIEELTLGPLGDVPSDALLDRRADRLSREARSRILAMARGNPLAILELPIPGEASPGTPVGLDAMSPGGLLARTFGRRMAQLPSATRNALTVAAASEDAPFGTVLVALRILRIADDALAPGEAAGVVTIEGDRVMFRHPLMRAAAYAGAAPSERRAAHRALATALNDARAGARWAWHRALAAVGVDELAADALEASAAASVSASSRARALERAARLSPQGPAQIRRLVAAALAAEASGNLQVSESLAVEVQGSLTEAIERAEIDHLLGRIWTRTGQMERAAAILTTGAATIVAASRDRAAVMLADAADAVIDDLDRAEELATRAVRTIRPGSHAEQLVMLRMGDVHGWRGDVELAREAWQRASALAQPDDPWSLRLAAEAHFSAMDDDGAVQAARRAADLARGRNAHNALTHSLEILAQAEARRGRLTAARDAVSEELDLVVSLGQAREERYASVVAAWIEAASGHEVECRAHATRAADLDARMGLREASGYALGVLELAAGHAAKAVDAFIRAAGDTRDLGADAIAPRSFVPAYVEALVRCGRRGTARSIAASYAAVAARTGSRLARALSSRCSGLVEGSIEELESAVDAFASLGNAYEAARTQLCLGELLRRRRTRAAAKAVLMQAFETFESMRADAWTERTTAELARAGASVRRRSPPRGAELTPSERNVARLVASGLSNREVSEHLFVTTNTVETHLRHIFQKLEVTSRTQLALAYRD